MVLSSFILTTLCVLHKNAVGDEKSLFVVSFIFELTHNASVLEAHCLRLTGDIQSTLTCGLRIVAGGRNSNINVPLLPIIFTALSTWACGIDVCQSIIKPETSRWSDESSKLETKGTKGTSAVFIYTPGSCDTNKTKTNAPACFICDVFNLSNKCLVMNRSWAVALECAEMGVYFHGSCDLCALARVCKTASWVWVLARRKAMELRYSFHTEMLYSLGFTVDVVFMKAYIKHVISSKHIPPRSALSTAGALTIWEWLECRQQD